MSLLFLQSVIAKNSLQFVHFPIHGIGMAAIEAIEVNNKKSNLERL